MHGEPEKLPRTVWTAFALCSSAVCGWRPEANDGIVDRTARQLYRNRAQEITN